MPGLAIICAAPQPSTPGGPSALSDALVAMLSALTLRGQRAPHVLFPELGIAVGQVGPERLSPPQAGWTAHGDNAFVAFVEGELLNAPALAHRVGLPDDTPPAEVVAALFRSVGPDAVDLLRGHCAVAVVDRGTGAVHVANDPLGLRPLYGTRATDGAILIASSPAALLAYPAVRREVDPAGLADFLAFGYGLGTRTLFCNIECLLPATQIILRNGEQRVRRYWRLGQDAPPEGAAAADLEALRHTFNETVVETARAAGHGAELALGDPEAEAPALSAQAGLGGPAGGISLALSGGMDSRAILSALVTAGVKVETLTHSIPGATDARISAELAHLARTTHHFYEVRGEDLAGQMLPATRLTGGALVGIDVHPLCFLGDIADYTRVALTGMGGALYKASAASGAVVGAGAQTLDGMADGLFKLLNYKLKPEADFPALLADDWLVRLRDQPRESIRETMSEVSRHVPLAGVSGIVFLQEYMRKYLTKGDLLVRGSIETRHPMVSRDLLAQVYHLPYEARKGGALLRYIVTRNFPAMADLPYEKDGKPMRYPLTPLDRGRQRGQDLWRSARRRLGAAPYRSVPSYRYGEWLRGPLRPFVYDVLLDPRTLARPYWRPETIRSWVAAHMDGQEHANRLGVLLSLELILREFVD